MSETSKKADADGSPHPFVSTMGVTVAELKKHIADWPETDAMGEPTEVWLATGHKLSSPCMSIHQLNYRMRDDGKLTSDLLLCSSEKVWNSANASGLAASAGSVAEVLDWIRTETLCGMVIVPQTTEDRVWNDAHQRVLGIIRNYQKGEGLFQMTRVKPPNAPLSAKEASHE